MLQLEYAGRMINDHPNLNLIVHTPPSRKNAAVIAARQTVAIANYLRTRWQVPAHRVISVETPGQVGNVTISFEAASDGEPIVETRIRS
jgi:hypothetical protein